MTAKKIVQVAGLILFTVVLPLGSYFYLKKGYDFQKEALSNLKDLGEVQPDLELTAMPDSVRVLAAREHKVGFNLRVSANDTFMLSVLERLMDQFVASETVYFNLFLGEDYQDDPVFWNQWIDGLPEKAQFGLFPLSVQQNNDFWLGNLGFEKYCPGSRSCHTIAVVDARRHIRSFYQVNNPDELKEMVRVSAIILPRKKVEDPVLKREKEM